MRGTSVFVVAPDVPKLPGYSMLQGDYPSSIERAMRLGYDGIEILVGDPARFEPRHIHALLDAAGLQVAALNSGAIEYMFDASLVSADDGKAQFAMSYLKASIAHCARLGCLQQVGIARGGAVPGRPMRWFKDRLVESLQELTRYANSLGVEMVLEYTNRFEINTINTGAEAVEIVERVGADNLGILIDTYHSYLEDPDVCQNIRALRRHVRHFHLHDSDGAAAMIGGGENDFTRIIQTCGEIGYRGWFSDGLQTTAYPEEEVRRSTASLRDLYAACGHRYQARAAGVLPVA